MIVLLEGSPISTEELWSSVSDHWVLGDVPDEGPSPPIAQFGRATISRKSFGDSKLLPCKNEGCHCVLGDLQCYRNVLVPFSRSTQSCLGTLRSVPSTSWLGFCSDMLCLALSTVGLYIDRCAFSKSCPVNWIYHRWTPSCRNSSRMINGNQIYLKSFSRFIAKGLNTYINKIFQFDFPLSHYGVLCLDWGKTYILIHFRIRL
jgi:hypothetical protein